MTNRIENTFTEKVYDNIHGFIYLSKAEKDILNTPYMQRLHFLKQNGLADLVFPGATHTRFSHSLGVLFIAEKIIQKLKKLPEKIKITNTDHQIVRLAALLHDVGHFPLSHTFEFAYLEYDKEVLSDEITKNETTDEKYISPLRKKFNNAEITAQRFLGNLEYDKDSYFNHENIGKEIISSDNVLNKKIKKLLLNIPTNDDNKINNENIDDYIKIIGGLITGKLSYIDNEVLNYTNVNQEETYKYHILSQIINSNLDADQMDYMLRDTISSGIKTTVRIDFLIDNMDICNKYITLDDKKHKVPTLCFHSAALQSIEQFLISKFYWYAEILNYEKAHIFNLIAKRIGLYMLLANNNEQFFNKYNTKKKYAELINNPDEFFFFNDSFFWDKLQFILSSSTTPKTIKNMANRLLERGAPKVITRPKFEALFNDAENELLSYNAILIEDQDYNKEKECQDYMIQKLNQNNSLYFLSWIKSREIYKPGIITEDELSGLVSDKNIQLLECFKESCDFTTCNEKENCKSILKFINNGKSILQGFSDPNDPEKAKVMYKQIIYDFS